MTIFHTRADLMQHPDFADLGTDSGGNPRVWRNIYACECGAEWEDNWSCQCDDECGGCFKDTTPDQSIWIGPDDPVLKKLWELLPEADDQGWGASVMQHNQVEDVFDLTADQAARFDAAISNARFDGAVLFYAAHDDATDHDDEIIYRSAPRWAWEIMDETLAMDAMSRAFDATLRESIRAATTAMILSCERGDDERISRADVEANDDEANG